MKSARDRGEFGNWLREQRLGHGYGNVPSATAALRADQGYGVAPSVWAELEAGTRRPSAEQRERLQAFFDVSAPSPASDSAAVAAALRELVEEVRLSRLASDRNADVLAQLLGVVLEGRLPPAGTGSEADAHVRLNNE